MVGNTSRAVCLGLFLAFPCVGCSDDDDEEEGDTESGTCNGVAVFSTCTEIEGDAELIAEEERICTDGGDTWTTEPCPVADLLGCCRYTFGPEKYLECFYTGYPATAMELQMDCVDILEGSWTTGGRG